MVGDELKGDEKRAALKKDRKVSILDRLVQEAIGEGHQLGHPDDPAQQLYPELWRWMAQTSAGKAHTMEPGRLTLSLVPGGVLATVNHRGLNMAVETTALYLDDVLRQMEAVLASANPPIKHSSRGQEKIRKKSKS